MIIFNLNDLLFFLRKSLLIEKDTLFTNIENLDDDHRVPSNRIPRVILQSQPSKPIIAAAAMGGIKVLPSTSYPSQRPLKSSYSSSSTTTKPRRVASFTIADTELPIDYRQYLRHTDQGVYLYGGEQQHRHQQSGTLEHSLGYYP